MYILSSSLPSNQGYLFLTEPVISWGWVKKNTFSAFLKSQILTAFSQAKFTSSKESEFSFPLYKMLRFSQKRNTTILTVLTNI